MKTSAKAFEYKHFVKGTNLLSEYGKVVHAKSTGHSTKCGVHYSARPLTEDMWRDNAYFQRIYGDEQVNCKNCLTS